MAAAGQERSRQGAATVILPEWSSAESIAGAVATESPAGGAALAIRFSPRVVRCLFGPEELERELADLHPILDGCFKARSGA